ncbi:class I SAM-dependent methyltransferase [Streptomyces sp. YIM S03343]
MKADQMRAGSEPSRFVREFVRDPLRVGAVAPSSPRLAERVVAPVPETGDPVIVELGPGTGVFTAAIQRRLAGRGRHLAVEINPRFADRLRERFPGVDVVAGDAARLPDILTTRGLDRADAVISGLPWTAFLPDAERGLVAAVTAGLVPDGAFTTFTYVFGRWAPPAVRLRRLLCAAFEELVPSRTVWANLPPALVYHARRPRIHHRLHGTDPAYEPVNPV